MTDPKSQLYRIWAGHVASREALLIVLPDPFFCCVLVSAMSRRYTASEIRRFNARIASLELLPSAIFDYLEIFHNRQRRHSSIGMHTPIEYELLHHNKQPAA